MDRHRLFGALRIAASLLCFAVCGLLIAQWARSYYWKDSAYGPVAGSRSFVIESIRGRINFYSYEDRNVLPWGLESSRWNTRRFGIDMGHGFLVGVPLWLFVFVAGTLGVAPLVARRRFGLYILLFVFAAVAVMWAVIIAVTG